MHTSRDDYLINTLRFFSAKEATQIYSVVLPESLTSHEIKETKAYKTYLGFATRATPPKKAQKFKKSTSPKLTTIPVSPEEPTGKSKRVKRPAKKSNKALARGVVIRETPEMPLSKKKEKVDVTRGKGIELLSQVALTEDAQFEEVQRKSMRDFHKTHPSGYGTVTKIALSVAKIKPSITSEGTGVKPGVPDVTEEESSKSKAESWENDEDDSNNEQDSSGEDSDQVNDSDDDKTQSDNENESDSEHETDENELGSESDQEENEEDIGDDEEEVKDGFVKTPSNDSNDEDETKNTDKAKGDKDEEMDYTTSQLYDDMDIRLNEPIDTDKRFIQEEGIDAEMSNIQQGNENPEISQVIKDAHVTLSTVPLKTEVLVTSSSHSSDLAAKFLNFLDIPHTDAEIVSPMDVHVHHEDPLQTQVTALVDEYLDARLGATKDEFMNYLSSSIIARVTEQVKIQLSLILPKEVSNFAPLVIQSMVTKSLEHAVLAKESSQPQSSYEAAATLTKFELKKIMIDKMDKSESYLAALEHRECYEGLIKSYDLDKTIFSTYEPKEKFASKHDWFTKPTKPQESTDPDWNVGKTPQQRQTQSWLMTLTSSTDKPSKTFDELMRTPIDFSAYIMNGLKINNITQETLMLQDSFRKLDWENPKGDDYPFDLTKPLPLFISGNRQKVLVDYFFNNDLKYLQGGVSIMTYTTSITKTKAAQYDLPGIKDMIPNIWVPIKVAYDKHALWGILH
ncbi:hypothetical protein Tco_1533345 [Tanacetum coccineum]